MRKPDSIYEGVQRLRLARAIRKPVLIAAVFAVALAVRVLVAQPAPAGGSGNAPRALPGTNGATAQPIGAQTAGGPAAGAQAAPATPPMPDWPANDRPSNAAVTWDSRGLSITAANSSLQQILKQITTETGAAMDGFTKDERIFGVYGPGPARDVITQLLDGTGYNVMLVGDAGNGTPRQILLTPRSTGGPQPPSPNTPAASDDDNEVEQQAEQPEPPCATSGSDIRCTGQASPPGQQEPQNGATPAVPVRTQQQLIQEMQQRLQQQQQQNPQ
jgi:hypothetical protein